MVMSELKEASLKILADTQLTFYQKTSEFVALYMHMIDQFSGDEEENLDSMLEIIPITPSPRMPMSFCRHSWNG